MDPIINTGRKIPLRFLSGNLFDLVFWVKINVDLME